MHKVKSWEKIKLVKAPYTNGLHMEKTGAKYMAGLDLMQGTWSVGCTFGCIHKKGIDVAHMGACGKIACRSAYLLYCEVGMPSTIVVMEDN